MPKVLLDEGLSRYAAELLRARGFDAVHVQEIGLMSASDDAILELARTQERIIFTLDHDFHQTEVAISGSASPSVVFLRFEHLKAAATAQVVTAVLESRQRNRRRSSGFRDGNSRSVTSTSASSRAAPQT